MPETKHTIKQDGIVSQLFTILQHYVIFFVMVAFVTTCCMMLFVSTLAATLDITLTSESINKAAKLTFANVLLLSFVYTVIDSVRRKLTVDRPVKHITDAAERFMQGDFSVRIQPVKPFGTEARFNEIIDCFNKMAEELSGVETLRTDFIANVSHEMKTPLAVMQNYGTLLQTPNLPDEQRVEYAKSVTDGSRKLADLMTNILKLNRLENQRIYPKAVEFDLGEQLCECLLAYENVWEKSEIEIHTDIAEDVLVQSDPELLSLVWNNLFSNAFKFTGAGGRVTVSLSAGEYYAVVKVIDTGCGMSPEVGAHIFEKFYQGDTSRATAGNGLGLALVKRIIDIIGGEISVTSEVGVGSTFTVQLRIAPRREHR
ncbi:MAG: HAMP domain-containing histidine kinase [Clostridia bacterium]|nr:HAMP domain-containing histidine kinase [Clostridia bacterium]